MRSTADVFKCDFCKEADWTYPIQEDLSKVTRGIVTIKCDKPNSEERVFDICGQCIKEMIDKTKG